MGNLSGGQVTRDMGQTLAAAALLTWEPCGQALCQQKFPYSKYEITCPENTDEFQPWDLHGIRTLRSDVDFT